MTDIKRISKLVFPIAEKYGAYRVALFGSRAKKTEKETSDYDFIISKGNIQSLFQLAAFIDELEKAFGGNVDVITDTSNDIRFLEQIKKDEVVIYEAERSNSTDENNGLLSADQRNTYRNTLENDYADERSCSTSLWKFGL